MAVLCLLTNTPWPWPTPAGGASARRGVSPTLEEEAERWNGKGGRRPVCTQEDWGHSLSRARDEVPSMSFCKPFARGFTHRAFSFMRAVAFVLRFPIRSGTGRRSATVAQTSIRGLATARTCVVAGLARTQGGHRKELRPNGLSRITMTCRPVTHPIGWRR